MNFALIFAGGIGKRMDSKELPKQFLMVFGKPVIIHTIEAFEKSPLIGAIVVVCLADYLDLLQNYLQEYHLQKVVKIVSGGASGQESISKGLSALVPFSKDPSKDLVLINDGVRPLISEELIADNIKIAQKNGNCITVGPVSETVVVLGGDHIQKTEDRSACRFAKAPQTFVLADVLSAHVAAKKDGVTGMVDSASLMLHYGHKLFFVECDARNLKITNQMDYLIYRALLEAEENDQLIVKKSD
jgi:2-C-methyl-D-erythritol 4-phosphate cytidylyltransferase